jgi:hypothetical protein
MTLLDKQIRCSKPSVRNRACILTVALAMVLSAHIVACQPEGPAKPTMGKQGHVGFQFDDTNEYCRYGDYHDLCPISQPISSGHSVDIYLTSHEPFPSDIVVHGQPTSLISKTEILVYEQQKDLQGQPRFSARATVRTTAGDSERGGQLQLMQADGSIYDEADITVTPAARFTTTLLESIGSGTWHERNDGILIQKETAPKYTYRMEVRMFAKDGRTLMGYDLATLTAPLTGPTLIDLDEGTIRGGGCGQTIDKYCRQVTSSAFFLTPIAPGQLDLVLWIDEDLHQTIPLTVVNVP